MTSYDHDNARLAETYDRLSDSQFEAGQRLVERLELEPGARVLDVGCGTGRLARWIAETLSDARGVVGIDPLAERIAIAKEKSPGIEFAVGQAEDLSAFANESFDAVCLSAVFHWVRDKPKALRQIARVLRPGGRVGLTTMPRELHLASTMAKVCGPVFGRSPYRELAKPETFALVAQSPTLTEIVTMVIESGLELGQLHVVQRRRTHATEYDVVDFVESSSFGNFLSLVPEDLRASLRRDLAAAFAPRKGADGVVLRDYGMLLIAQRT